MRIIIDTIAELDELAEVWARGRLHQARETTINVKMDGGAIRKAIDETLADLRKPDTRPVTAEGAVIPVEPQDAEQPASAGAGAPPSIDPVPEATPKRKRRTKAEIAADEAAAKAAQEVDEEIPTDEFGQPLGHVGAVDAVEPTPPSLVNHDPDAAIAVGVNPEIEALAATIDGADKMAHMNEGRDFIAKHGFPKYNETFALADVPQNIAAHTPEQAALHRAAMQWLPAQAG